MHRNKYVGYFSKVGMTPDLNNELNRSTKGVDSFFNNLGKYGEEVGQVQVLCCD